MQSLLTIVALSGALCGDVLAARPDIVFLMGDDWSWPHPGVVGCRKKYVRRDLVIWPEEDMTAWTGEGIPAVVMEWKRDREEACRCDIEWLGVFCGRYPGVIGFSVCARLAGVRGCVFTRVGA